MKFNQEVFHRKSIRLRGYDYSQPGAYFVTICTHQRPALFGEIVDGEMHLNAAGVVVEKCWHAIPQHFPWVRLDSFVIMPNHVHGIVFVDRHDAGMVGAIHVGANDHSPLRLVPGTSRSLGSVIRGFKIGVTKWFRANTDIQPVWQRNYHEHIIRNESAYLKIAEYIQTNPLQWQDDTYHVGANDYSPYGLT